jgi:hypothetical protein
MQGNPAANNVKWGLRALAVVLVPITASFPQVRCISPMRVCERVLTCPVAWPGRVRVLDHVQHIFILSDDWHV